MVRPKPLSPASMHTGSGSSSRMMGGGRRSASSGKEAAPPMSPASHSKRLVQQNHHHQQQRSSTPSPSFVYQRHDRSMSSQPHRAEGSDAPASRKSSGRHVQDRPRPISTGRMHHPNATPSTNSEKEMMKRAIRELRKKKEESIQMRTSPVMTATTTPPRSKQHQQPLLQQQRSSTPTSRLATAEASQSAKKQHAFPLKEAEDRIGSLMQELEELRFFHEIDEVQPSSPLNSSPRKSNKPHLSPRQLSGLDRHELELEAQELQRCLDIANQTESSLQAQIRMLESAGDEAQRLESVEQSVQGLSEWMNQHAQKLQQEAADAQQEFTKQLQHQQETLKQCEQEWKQSSLLQIQQLESTHEAQLASAHEAHVSRREVELQARVQALEAALQQKESVLMEKERLLDTKQDELQNVQRDTAQSTQEMQETHAGELESLHAKQQELVVEMERRQQVIFDQERAHSTQLTAQVEKLGQELESVQTNQEGRILELKRSFDLKEQRRLDDLVQSQSKKNIGYEERLSDLQKQLKLSSDRHEAEMEIKQEEYQSTLLKQLADRDASWEGKLQACQGDLENLRSQHDERHLESKHVSREWERKHVLSQSQVHHLQDTLERTKLEVTEKESKLTHLTERLKECDEKCFSLLTDLESQQEREHEARDELLTARKTIAKLRSDVTRKESETFARIQELEQELEQNSHIMERTTRSTKTAEEEVRAKWLQSQQTLREVQQEFAAEQTRYESLESDLRVEIAKLEGRLSATEGTMKEKRQLIEELELKLLSADEQTSNGTKLQSMISTLRHELDSVRLALDAERKMSHEKDDLVVQIQEELDESAKAMTEYDQKLEHAQLEIESLQRQLDRSRQDLESSQAAVVTRVEQVVEMEQQLQTMEASKAGLEEELSQLRQDKEEQVQSLRSVSQEESLQMEQQREALQACQTKVSELETELAEKQVQMSSLETVLKTDRAALRVAQEATKSYESSTTNLEQRITELESNAEQERQSVIALETVLKEKTQAMAELQSTVASTESQELISKLRQDLSDKETTQKELSHQMKVVIGERSEAINALEQVLEEIQVRQEEYDALGDELDRREEELEHAKIIATKALASAQEIKTRYKEKGHLQSEDMEDLHLELDELHANVDYLTEKNDKLRNKMTRLECELFEKNKECAMLKDEMRELEGRSTCTPLTHSASGSSSGSPPRPPPPTQVYNDGFIPLEGGNSGNKSREGRMNRFMLMENAYAPNNINDISASSDVNCSMSTRTADLGEATKWLADFDDSDSAFSADDARTDPGGAIPMTKRAAERNAIRKYAHQRPLKNHNDNTRIHV